LSSSISSSSAGGGVAFFFLDRGGLDAAGAGGDKRCSSSSSGGIDSSSGSSWTTDRETCVSAPLTGDGLLVLVVRLGDDGPAFSDSVVAPGRRLTRRLLLLSPRCPFSSTSEAGAGDLAAVFLGDLAFAVVEADLFECEECRFIASRTVDELTSSTICSLVVVVGLRDDAIESARGCTICLVTISRQSVRISLIISPSSKALLTSCDIANSLEVTL